MVALPPSSPTHVSSVSPLYPTYGNTHSRASSCASSARNLSPGPSAPSSPSSSSSSSPRFPGMDPGSGRAMHSPSSVVFPLPKSHPFSKLHKSSPSLPLQPEHHYGRTNNSSSGTTSLDLALAPNRSTMAKIQGPASDYAPDHEYDGASANGASRHNSHHSHQHQHQHQPHQHHQLRIPDEPSLMVPLSAGGKHRSRIDIANLLNRATSVEAPNATDASTPNHLRAITEEADDLDSRHPSVSSSSSSSLVPGHNNNHNNNDYRHDEGHVRSFVPSVPSDHRYPYGARPASFSSSSSALSSTSTVPMYASSTSSQPPRLATTGSLQRSASVHMDRNQDYDYTGSYEEDRQHRTDRSKSDYALHQRNYGPFMAGSSPPLAAATLSKGNSVAPVASSGGAVGGGGGERGNPGAHLYYDQAPRPYPPHSYHSASSSSYPPPPPLTKHSSGGATGPVSSNIGPINNNGSHGQHHSQTHAVSSARPLSNYAQVQTEMDKSEQLRRPSHGPIVPILPPPAAMLSAAAAAGESKPPRIYGRDSTADDIWPPIPRKARVVPVDAPNESRPYTYTNSAMLPPPPPPYPPVSSASSYSSSSSSALPYSSNYSEQKPARRIYGIDAADIPTRKAPPAPYGSNQFSKPMPETREDHGHVAYPRQFNGPNVAPSTPSHGSQGYGYSASSGHHHSVQEKSRYDYEQQQQQQQRGNWNAQQQRHGPNTSTPSIPSVSSFAQARPYSRPQSPTMDIKPPTWYQNYAHSVAPKPQARPSYGHQDPHYYAAHPATQQHQQHSNGWHGRPGYPGSALDPLVEDQRYDGSLDSEEHHHRSSSSSKRSSKGTGTQGENLQSIHPFDTSAESRPSKSKKIKRIKNVGQDEDMIVMDDEFYAVKAKRKRANASQLSVLNAAFERSYFPSTEERLRLSKQCRMCPRTVQIWFQNKRQSVKARTEAMEAGGSGEGIMDDEGDLNDVDGDEDGEDSQGANSNDGQKRSIDDQGHEKGANGSSRKSRHASMQGGGGSTGAKKQDPSIMTPSEAVMSALHIQLDGRSVDYFSRKRRATIAKMEQNGQKQQQKQQQQQQQPVQQETS